MTDLTRSHDDVPSDVPSNVLDVVLVVVSYNSAGVLPGLLSSLDAALNDVSWHFVLADNDSRDDSVAVVQQTLPGATVVQTGRNAGYAAGLNAGVAAAPAHRSVLVLNPDVRLDPGSVRTLLDALDAPGVGITAPLLRDAHGDLHLSLRRRPTVLTAWGDALLGARRAGRWPALGELVTDPTQYLQAHVVDWAEGSTQLVSAECWAATGGWDETYFLYSEETEFALRAADHGFVTLFVPTAKATHIQGESSTSPGLWALLVANKVRLARRRDGLLAGVLFWAAMVLREATRAARGSATSRAALTLLLSPRALRERPGPQTVARVTARAGS